jgi:hypothetical protein
MRWIRLHLTFGGRLGLLALALQLALTFGHVHVGEVAPDAVLTVAAERPAADDPVPPQPSERHDHQYCVLCATLQLAATALAATPPALPAGAECNGVRLALPAEAIPRAGAWHSFQARGPPIA